MLSFDFRRKIYMNAISDVLVLTQADCDEVLRLYQRCHNLIDAHDSNVGFARCSNQLRMTGCRHSLPTKKIVEEIRRRRKITAKASKAGAASQPF